MLLGLLKTEVVRAFEQELARQGLELRFSQVQALMRLSTLGPMSASELARSMGHDGGALTRMLDQLEERGYLVRKQHALDRRTLRIELTPAGSKLCRSLLACRDRVMGAAQSELTPNERRQLIHSLQRVLATLRQTD